eukprot:m.192666 g.192666  ORF g.192666 m.192666 type:complete len:138 (-) comp53667_c0_seq3:346-759(-)
MQSLPDILDEVQRRAKQLGTRELGPDFYDETLKPVVLTSGNQLLENVPLELCRLKKLLELRHRPALEKKPGQNVRRPSSRVREVHLSHPTTVDVVAARQNSLRAPYARRATHPRRRRIESPCTQSLTVHRSQLQPHW